MTLNPEIFAWARNTAGLSADEAARALGFNNTRDRSAAERLRALEAGDEEPSRSVLVRMAKAYRRSLLVFYLAEPPRTGDRGQDFRTVPSAPPPLYNPALDALIRDVRGRQTIVRSLLEETEPQPVDFVGAASMNDPTDDLARRIVERLQFSLADFRRQARVEDAFNYLREKIEAAGAPDGTVAYLTEGELRASDSATTGFDALGPIHPFTREAARPLGAAPVDLEIGLLPIAARLPAGYRLRIAIAGADAGSFERIPAHGPATFTIGRGGSRGSFLSLPVMGRP